MAHYMSSSCSILNKLTNKICDINMVAELVDNSTGSAEMNKIDFGSLGEINMIAADPATPFDPVESERRVKELIGETVNKAFEALRNELKAEILQLNAKFDSVKAAQDLNDSQVKGVVSLQSDFVNNEFAGVKNTFTQVEANVVTTNAVLQQLTAEVNSLKTIYSTGVAINPPGITTTTTETRVKNVMEHKVVQNLEKLTNNPADYFIWNLRFKNAMSQVNPKYKELLESAEKLRVQIPTYEHWETSVLPGLIGAVGTAEATQELAKELYTVLVDKCTNTQVIQFANDEEDGFYAFFSLYRSFKVTAGIGQIEKRDLVMHPTAAKRDGENYDCIVNWEREVREQEKLIEPSKRPLLSEAI